MCLRHLLVTLIGPAAWHGDGTSAVVVSGMSLELSCPMELFAEFGASQGILLGMSKQTAGTAFPFYKEGAVPAACLDSLSPARELIQCITQLAALWQHLGQRG